MNVFPEKLNYQNSPDEIGDLNRPVLGGYCVHCQTLEKVQASIKIEIIAHYHLQI